MLRSARRSYPRRRFSKDYERLPETAEAMIHAVMSRIMLRTATRAAWRLFACSEPPIRRLPNSVRGVHHGQIGLLQARRPAGSTTVTRQ